MKKSKVNKIKKSIKNSKLKIKSKISHSKSINKISKKKVFLHTAIFGAGCFWGVEEAFRTTAGVVSTEVGYAGGTVANATYDGVCSGQTDHAEVVKVIFNSSKTSYKKLLEIFWRIHDPTQMNRQGPDVGTQYRSVIFYTNSGQKKDAGNSMREEQKHRPRTIATVIEKVGLYVKAEDYHQKYVMKTGKNVC